jgi:hypothetical protein
MDELTRFCTACQAEKEIVSIVKDDDGGVIKMSCGHSVVLKVVANKIGLSERTEDEVRRDGKRILRGVSKPTKGFVTKRSCRDCLNLDWKTRTKYHKVEELQDDGTWKVIHEHTDPFETKKPT